MVLVAKFASVLPQLDERQRRLVLGAEAIALGRGGITAVAAAAGVSRPTVTRGVAAVRADGSSDGRVRKHGGGRKSLTVTDPGLPQRWMLWSTRTPAATQLHRQIATRVRRVQTTTKPWIGMSRFTADDMATRGL